MEVYAFEWCDCVHESAYAVESLHTTKRDAVAAMVREANRRWLDERRRKLMWGCRSVKFDPLIFQSWRVRSLVVHEELAVEVGKEIKWQATPHEALPKRQ